MIGRLVRSVVVGGAAAVLITGCATGRKMAIPEARPLGAQYPSVGIQARAGADGAGEKPAEPTGTLRMGQALAAALMRNPELGMFSYDVRAAEARILQARALPNPELEVELEEYDRDGEGFDSSEMVVAVGQLFELGGKRHWRTRVAEAEGELAGWDYESTRLDVFTETAQRFTAVVAAQQRLELAESAVALARKTSAAVGERVKAGKEPPLQAAKSEAELEMARLAALAAQNDLGVTRKRLAAMWGAERADFGGVEGSLDRVPDEIPSMEVLRPRLALNPDLARWSAEIRLRQAALSSERAARVPDLQAAVGLQRFEEDSTDSLAFGIGLPLPLFDRNQGNITAAANDLSRAEAERSATELGLVVDLAEIHATLTTARQRVETLRGKVVPATEQAFEAAHEGYRQGKFGFLDMLDAQRGLFEARGALVEALSDYHVALTDIQRITATSIEELTQGQQEDQNNESE